MPGLPSRVELPPAILNESISDQTAAIAARAGGYDDVPLDTDHSLYGLETNPLVHLSDYGVNSLSYYARPNVTGHAIPGVSPDVLVRRDTARRIEVMNTFVRNSDWVREFCDGEVEIRVDDGLRSKGLQQYVSQVRYPEFLRRKLERQPGETDEVFEARVQEGAAKSISKSQNPPHATGGVVDLRIVRLDGESEGVSYGYDHQRRETVRTDYFEQHPSEPNAERFAQIRRLVFHLAAEVGGVVNPLEPWHYGFVDLADRSRATDGLTAVVSGASHRFYDSVEGMPDADPSLLEALRQV